jgi:hypothetical protein
VPRLARLLALALRCERLFPDGVVENFAKLADLGHSDPLPGSSGHESVAYG